MVLNVVTLLRWAGGVTTWTMGLSHGKANGRGLGQDGKAGGRGDVLQFTFLTLDFGHE